MTDIIKQFIDKQELPERRGGGTHSNLVLGNLSLVIRVLGAFNDPLARFALNTHP